MKVTRLDEENGPYYCDECPVKEAIYHDWIFSIEGRFSLDLCEKHTDELAKELTYVLRY